MAQKRISETIDTGIIRRTSGNNISYVFTVACGMDTSGKQIRRTTTWKPDKGLTLKKADKKAKEEYIQFKNRCMGGASFNENMRFKELCEEYFKVYAPNNLKPITAYNYKKMFEYRLIPYFGNKKLKDITTPVLSNYFCNITKTNKDGHEEPISPRTAKRIFIMMQSVFHYAIKQRIIKDNPCDGVELPRKDSTQEEKRKFLTEEEFPKFLEMFDGEKSDFDRMILILLHTGMRSGELLGLQWNDIDFDRKLIFINHTLSDVGGIHFLTTPKTKGSKRIITMNSTVTELLKIQKKYELEKRMMLKEFEHPEMIFTSNLGNYKDRSSLNTSFKKRLKGTGFEFMTLHCLRHTNATLLLNSGVDIKIISEHLGHSDISTTANIYADVLASSRQKTAEILEWKLAK